MVASVIMFTFSVSSRNRPYTAPEMYSKHSKPIGSEGTLEKVSNMYMIVSECFMDLIFCLPQC